jgi:two-component system, sensor histidine kinase and response regulator
MFAWIKARLARSVETPATGELPAAAPLDSSPQSEARLLHPILDSMAEGVIVCDRNSRLVQFNRAAAVLMGKDLNGADLHALSASYQIRLSAGAPPIPVEQRPLARAMRDEPVDNSQFILSGTAMAAERWIEASARPVRDTDGTIRGGIVVMRDITDRKAAEAQMARARDMALETERLRAAFLRNMSHEIRTPLNGIVGMTQLLLSTDLIPEQREYAETVQLSADLLSSMVNDLLDFSKLATGKVALQQVDFDLGQVVETAAGLFADRAEKKGVDLVLNLGDETPRSLRGDSARLQQVLVNLIGNAVKFTQRGEVVIRIGREKDLPDGIIIFFEIRDTGIGISKDAQKLLFQPFSQADGSTTRRHGGPGLGLAISAHLVGLMGGRIEVESELARGSAFRFTMKFALQDRPARTSPAPQAGLERLRILVVDDNPTVREVVCKQFAALQMHADSAGDGAEALVALRQRAATGSPYDAAILDSRLPSMNGLQLARAVRSDPSLAVMWLLMVGRPDSEEPNRPLDAQVDGWLARPIRSSEILRYLKDLLARRDSSVPARNSGDPAQASVDSHQEIRVLVVEDNPINQKLALKQLHKLGYAADAVDSGTGALNAMARQPYTVVLMDCQMPGMDGYQATIEIRQRESGSRHTIIIAMTAQAQDGARERCIAAGMDDYITKPVRLETLSAVLGRWIPATADHAAASLGSNNLPDCESINQETLNELRELSRCADDRDLIGELVDMFFGEFQPRIVSLRGALARGELDELADGAHGLRGACLSLGLSRMALLCGRLEMLARRGTSEGTDVLLDELGHEAGTVRPRLEAERASTAAV